MAISLYDATVPGFIQILDAAHGFMGRTREHCAAQGLDREALLDVSLYPDMLPFHAQVRWMIKHSAGVLDSIKEGTFIPLREFPPGDFAYFENLLAQASAQLQRVTPAEVEALHGRSVAIKLGSGEFAMTAENFLLSLSLPNFHFHASIAYGILRMKGVPLGKRDFLGAMRINP